MWRWTRYQRIKAIEQAKTSVCATSMPNPPRWGDPISLLAFPHLSPLEKLRYGLMMFAATKLVTALVAGAAHRIEGRLGLAGTAAIMVATPQRMEAVSPALAAVCR